MSADLNVISYVADKARRTASEERMLQQFVDEHPQWKDAPPTPSVRSSASLGSRVSALTPAQLAVAQAKYEATLQDPAARERFLSFLEYEREAKDDEPRAPSEAGTVRASTETAGQGPSREALLASLAHQRANHEKALGMVKTHGEELIKWDCRARQTEERILAITTQLQTTKGGGGRGRGRGRGAAKQGKKDGGRAGDGWDSGGDGGAGL